MNLKEMHFKECALKTVEGKIFAGILNYYPDSEEIAMYCDLPAGIKNNEVFTVWLNAREIEWVKVLE